MDQENINYLFNQAQCAYEGNSNDFSPPIRFVAEGEYPESTQEQREREKRAKAVCARCCVQELCIQFAYETGEADGEDIWGGMNKKERNKIFKKAS